MWGCWHGLEDIVRLLVTEGAALDCTNGDGASALIMAVCGNHEDCVRALVDGGADESLSCNGKTAWEWAHSSGHVNIADLLHPETEWV